MNRVIELAFMVLPSVGMGFLLARFRYARKLRDAEAKAEINRMRAEEQWIRANALDRMARISSGDLIANVIGPGDTTETDKP